MNETVLRIKELKKYYRNNDNLVKAIDGLNLEIAKGQFVSVLGASGSGKTTLIELMAGILAPTSGEMSICDQVIYKIKKSPRYKAGSALYYNLDHALGLEKTKLPATSPVTGESYPQN
jgi:ABC-type sugar transport system ATPase subunit